MAEILFRGKRIDNGNWIVGQLLRYEDGRSRIVESHTDIFCYEKDSSIIQTVAHEVIPDTVGQFTGLTDTKGKKIFEGDILQYWNRYREVYAGTCVVKYGAFNCSCCDGVYGWYLEDGDIRDLYDDIGIRYEVRGNIYDNLELMEG